MVNSSPHNLIPLSSPLLTLAFINLPKPSAAIINRNSDSGSPYVNPRDGLKVSVGVPLSSMDMLGVDIIDIIHYVHLSSKPYAFRILWRYS